MHLYVCTYIYAPIYVLAVLPDQPSPEAEAISQATARVWEARNGSRLAPEALAQAQAHQARESVVKKPLMNLTARGGLDESHTKPLRRAIDCLGVGTLPRFDVIGNADKMAAVWLTLLRTLGVEGDDEAAWRDANCTVSALADVPKRNAFPGSAALLRIPNRTHWCQEARANVVCLHEPSSAVRSFGTELVAMSQAQEAGAWDAGLLTATFPQGLDVAVRCRNGLADDGSCWRDDDVSHPLRVQVSIPRTNSVRRGLVYVKTHKTASSTLLNIILRMSIALNLTCTPPANGHKGYGCPMTLPSTLSNLSVSTVFAQHVAFAPGLLERIAPKPPLLITVMREPVDQAISAYLYPAWKHIRQAIGGTNWTDHVARLERGVRHGLSCFFNNSQAHDMGYEYYRNPELAVAAYDLILITEDFDKSLLLLKRLLARHGWPLTDRDLTYVVSNKGSVSIDQQTTLSMRRVIADSPLIAHDRGLYDKAKQRFDAEWRASKLQAPPPLASCVDEACGVDYLPLMRRCRRA